MEFFSKVLVAVFSRHTFSRTLELVALLYVCLQSEAVATKTPLACSHQGSLGFPSLESEKDSWGKPCRLSSL
jgi:hypothetical protein